MELAYTRKPTIRLIATDDAPADKVAQIGYGIEEEGIPFSLISPDELSDPVSLAHVAATQSQLLVGIACDGRDAVLHYRNLPLEEFIYRINDNSAIRDNVLRIIRSNTARVVNGFPFKQSHLLHTSL